MSNVFDRTDPRTSRWIDTFGIFINFLSVAVVIIATVFPALRNGSLLYAWSVGVLSGVLFISFIYNGFSYLRNINLQNRLNNLNVDRKIIDQIRERDKDSFERIQQVSQEGSKIISLLYAHSVAKAGGYAASGEEQNSISLRVSMYLLYFLDNVKETFDALTGYNCSSCIKFLLPANVGGTGEILVKTYMRDACSYGKRKSSDAVLGEYNYKANTAFEYIMNSEVEDMHYISNNLRMETMYNTANNKYSRYYNATVVVPICLKKSDEPDMVYGFLCVDNKRGGFDEIIAPAVLQAYADQLLMVLMMGVDLELNEALGANVGA